MTLLTVDNLHTRFETNDGVVRAVDGASLTIDRGEIVGLVGESGSGKSVLARSIVGLHSPGRIVEGAIDFDGVDLTDVSASTRERYRGTDIAMVFQDPTATLNPVFDVGEQIAESLRVHDDSSGQSLLDFCHVPLVSDRSRWRRHRERAIELMDQVGIADPEDRVDAYPHELSGGMCQRAMLAIALAGDPDLLIADEPTTALDTTTQARILDQLRELAAETDTAVLVISHDFGVVADCCDRVAVMYGGEIVERGPTDRLLESPEHPYTRGLLSCLLRADDGRDRLPTIDGTVPERFDGGPGCPFASRCSYGTDDCERRDPAVRTVGPDHEVACHELEAVRADDSPAAAGSPSESTPPGRPRADPSESVTRDRARADGSRTIDARGRSGSAGGSADRGDPILEARGVTRTYDLADSAIQRAFGDSRTLRAVDGVNLAVYPGETVGLVGESASGKSTLAKLLTGLEAPSTGEVRFDGEPVGTVADRTADQLADVGVVFQNPQGSINPRQRVRETIAEPLLERGWDSECRRERVRELLDLVGLAERYGSRRPHQLSGGQLQRVAIARAIALEPRVVVFDEPVSALDVSVRAQLLNLLADLQRRLGLTYLVISHDLDVVRHVADRVAVMYLGEIVERGPAERVFDRPSHPYTAALLEAVPRIDDGTDATRLEGPIPSGVDVPSGCRFHPRCPIAEPVCETDEPDSVAVGGVDSHCHFAQQVASRGVTEDSESPRDQSPDPPDTTTR
ncbi:ABC transporter ATP-binding protein [Salinadaptatus halalkaliphilus]|uniref:ABC transporter ATP-binding protein n=1 Tax=Salinadaptatus halalkaliphilus TaxID=2419781 RepID=A0A4V3VL05_9EURY|nr:ABC transporter ATP-binding protein [Salinadaptatus halalkaliphilus]THE63837.1 ABC transporter ATP-binding protein [Salinadaptatus halalkaliphilus]